MSKALYVGVSAKRDLPAGYTQLEYIQSSGTQSIDTGYKATSENYRIKCSFFVPTIVNDSVLFGGGASTDIISALIRNSTLLHFYVGSGSVSETDATFSQGVKYEMECHANSGTFTVTLNGVTYSGSYSGTINKDYTLCIFANNISGSAAAFSTVQFSEFQIYDNDTLVRDYVPCKNASGVVGLYDMANAKFYTNAGTGTFTAGPEITGEPVARKGKAMYAGMAENLPYKQPVLTADGTLGGSAFAVYASNITVGYEAYKAFGSAEGSVYSSAVNPNSQTVYYTIYTPFPVKIKKMTFENVPSGLTSNSPKAFSLQGSNDNSSWTTIGSYTNTNNVNSSRWSIDANGGFYKYHRLVITSANTENPYVNIGKIILDAVQQTVNIARKAVSGYAGENGVARMFWGESGPALAATFADNDWETIIWACQNNAVPDTWAVGDQKAMTINGTDYMIDIIGKNHDDYSDGSGKAPLTLQMHDCYGTKFAMNRETTNLGGWADCAMRAQRLPAIFARVPSEVQAGIKEVNKLTSVGYRSSDISTTKDKLFLLSEVEVFGNNIWSYVGEGNLYDYYAKYSRLKIANGSASYWWTRSPAFDYNSAFCDVDQSGERERRVATYSLGVSPAFCF